jgi:MFS family permease
MMPQLGAPVGFIAANGLFLILGAVLSEKDFLAWGWRLPFIASSVLVVLGLWVRLKLTETAEFTAALEEGPPPGVPIVKLFRNHLAATLTATLAVVTCFAIFYITTAFTLTHATQTMGLPRESLLGVQLIAILFLAAGILHAGWWADRSSPRTVLIAGCIGTIPLGLVYGPAIASGSLLWILIATSIGLYLMGFAYGPLGAWLTDRFPTRIRYTGASMAFNVGGIIGGGIAPMAAQMLATTYGTASVGLFLTIAALCSLVGLLLSPKSKILR